MHRLLLLAATLVTACAQPPAEAAPLNPARLGQVVPGADGEPDVECRAIEIARCVRIGVGSVELGRVDIDRVVVSCLGAPCTPADGAFRIDTIDLNGIATEIGRGAYGDTSEP